MQEVIEWKEESVEAAPYSDSYASIELLLIIWHVATDRSAAVVLGHKGKDEEWWIDGYSKNGILNRIWKVKYWAPAPSGPEE